VGQQGLLPHNQDPKLWVRLSTSMTIHLGFPSVYRCIKAVCWLHKISASHSQCCVGHACCSARQALL